MTQLSLKTNLLDTNCVVNPKPKADSKFMSTICTTNHPQVRGWSVYPILSHGFMDVLALDLPITFPTCRSSSCISFSSFWASRSSPPSIPCASSRSSKLDASQEVSNHQIQCFREIPSLFWWKIHVVFLFVAKTSMPARPARPGSWPFSLRKWPRRYSIIHHKYNLRNYSIDIWYDMWYMIYDILYMIYDIWYMIYDIWYMIYDIWYMIYDILYTIYDILYTIYDILYMIYDIWYVCINYNYTTMYTYDILWLIMHISILSWWLCEWVWWYPKKDK